MTTTAFVPGLMDRSRFDGLDVVFVSDRDAALAASPSLMLVDLDRCENPEDFRLEKVRVIGFASHVDADRQAAGRAAGFDEVLPRSVFFRRLRELVAR
jgi:hypothetical protein